MPRILRNEHSMDLYDAILQLKDKEECFNFFHDLCSIAELYAMEQRYDVAKKLFEGKPFVLKGHKVAFRLFKEETFLFVTEIYLNKK